MSRKTFPPSGYLPEGLQRDLIHKPADNLQSIHLVDRRACPAWMRLSSFAEFGRQLPNQFDVPLARLPRRVPPSNIVTKFDNFLGLHWLLNSIANRPWSRRNFRQR